VTTPVRTFPRVVLDLSMFSPAERRELSHALARAMVHQTVEAAVFPRSDNGPSSVLDDLRVLMDALDGDRESAAVGGWTERLGQRSMELSELMAALDGQGQGEQRDTAGLVSRLMAALTAATGWTRYSAPGPRSRPGLAATTPL
jgi:hypothetical protein